MKKRYLILMIALCYNAIIAQTLCTKGHWIVGSNFVNDGIYNKESIKNYTADTLTNNHTKITKGIAFAPFVGVGYFVRNNFCIGAGFGSNFVGTIATLIPNQLFFRYYLMQKRRSFSFAKEANLSRHALFFEGVLNASYSNNSTQNTTQILPKPTTQANETTISFLYGGNIGVGYTYLLTKHIALELLGIYNYQTGYQKTNTSSLPPSPSTKSTDTSNGFNVLFGVQAYF